MGSGASKAERLATAPGVTVYDAAIRGPVRPSQEDRHVALRALSDAHEEVAYFAVFDGHNGTAAANHCAERLHEEVDARLGEEGELPARGLKAAFVAADDSFLVSGASRREQESGCTAVVAVLNRLSGRLLVGNAGDARCVLSRKGEAVAMTTDHKPGVPSERRRIEAAGRRVENGRLDGCLAVSRAIGDLSMKLELVRDGGVTDPEKFALSPVPDTQETQLTRDDEFLLLACDGVFDVLSNQEAVDFVRERLPMQRLRAPPPSVLRAERGEAAAAAAEDEEDPAAAARAVMARLAAAGNLDEEEEEEDAAPAPADEQPRRGRGRAGTFAPAADAGPTAEEVEALKAARRTMRARGDVQDMALQLANHAVEKGSTDNVSVVIVLLDPRKADPEADPLRARVC